ncbi:MAG TPA: hypothetical protein VD735_02230 [Candidatus Saccharimonadales bacterium]|nr:hypothetical protein [Candidatus Saccharimonadales bacterium]
MRKSMSHAFTSTKRHTSLLLAKNSFVVVLCAALALILGALSVGAVYVATKPSAPVIGEQQATPQQAPAGQAPVGQAGQVTQATEPLVTTTAPTAPQLPDVAPEQTAEPSKTGISLTTDKDRLQLHLQAPILTEDGITVSVPNMVQPVIETLDSVTRPIKNLLQ